MVYTWYYMVYAWYILYMVLLHYISLSIHVNWKACSTSGSSSRHALGDARNQPHPLNGHQPASATLGWKDSELVDVALGALRVLRWKSLKAMASARQEMQWDAMRSIHPHEYWSSWCCFCAQRNAKHYSLSLVNLVQMQSDSVKPQSAAMNWRHLFFMFSCLCQKVCCNPILSVKPSIEIIRVV